MRRDSRASFWNDTDVSEDDKRRTRENSSRVLERLIDHALAGTILDRDVVAQWHRDCFTGLSYVTNPDLLGRWRGTAPPPELKRMVVLVGGVEGVPPERVHQALGSFFRQLSNKVAQLTDSIVVTRNKTRDQLRRIAELAGWAHGEWVRIHPFANGSGRTARLIANWVLVRFQLPPIVWIRPRPDHPYGSAAAASMTGDHAPTASYILSLLESTP